MSNSIIREVARQQLESMLGPHLQGTAHLAAMMHRFEVQHKWDYNYMRPDNKPIILTSGKHMVQLMPHVVRQAMERALGPGLQTLKDVVEKLYLLKKDFAIVLCGGSYCSPGLQRELEEYLAQVQHKADCDGFKIKAAYLHKYDTTYWYVCVRGDRPPP